MPETVYRDDPSWVPPLLLERRRHLDPRLNPFFAHAETMFWTALRDNRPVGRISAQVNHAHLGLYRDKTGHFGFLEAEDDEEVFAQLLRTAEAWLRERGMQRIVGPFSLSINDESGILIDGFSRPPYVMMGHGRPYYPRRIEEQGYVKVKDLVAYAYDLSVEPPVAMGRIYAKALKAESLHFRSISMSRFNAEIATIVDIFNDAWANNWGFLPFTEADLAYLAKALKPLIRGEDVAVGEVEGVPAAMAVALPNVNEAIADLGGRLFPMGWAKLLWRLKVKGTRTVRMPLMGVRRVYHGTAISAALTLGVIDRLRVRYRDRGCREAELSWVLEDNRPMRRLIEMYGAREYKRYRLYGKDLG